MIRVGEGGGGGNSGFDRSSARSAGRRAKGRTEALKAAVGDAIRYPPFVLGAAGCVLCSYSPSCCRQCASVLTISAPKRLV